MFIVVALLNLNRFELIQFELNLFQMYNWILNIPDDDYLSNSRNASYDAENLFLSYELILTLKNP
jgi:hypothetical protein